jgi:hypothetical protein
VVSNSSIAQPEWAFRDIPEEKGTTRQPAAFSLGSIRRLRVSHSELLSDAFTEIVEVAMNYTVITLSGRIVQKWGG